MRARSVAVAVVWLCACSGDTQTARQGDPPAKHGPVEAAPEASVEPPSSVTDEPVVASESGVVEAEVGTESGADAVGVEEAGATEPGDPLAPELPDGPEPGSAEADAELLALLDESTLTQEEFERGFGKDGPKIDGDAFEFGPGSRTRGKPEVRLGRVEGAVGDALEALVESDQNKLASCLGMALTKDEGATGSLTVRAELDGKGEVTKASASETSIGGSSEIRTALVDCVVSVVEDWKLAASAGSSIDIPLSLSTEI